MVKWNWDPECTVTADILRDALYVGMLFVIVCVSNTGRHGRI